MRSAPSPRPVVSRVVPGRRRAILAGAALLACVVAATVPSGPVRAQDLPPPKPGAPVDPPADAPTAGLPWIDGLAAGRRAAAARAPEGGEPPFLFVYVRRASPPSEACLALEQGLLSRPALAEALASRAVPVRISGGSGADADAEAFLRSYAVPVYPILWILDARGHLVVPQFPATVDGVRAALDRAVAEQASFRKLEQASRAAGPSGTPEYRRALFARMAWEDLTPLLRARWDAALAATPPAEEETTTAGTELAGALRAAGDGSAERAVLERLVAAFPTSSRRGGWRVRLATLFTDTMPARTRDEFGARMAAGTKALEDLLAAVRRDADAAAEPAVLAALGNALIAQSRAADGVARLDEALAHPRIVGDDRTKASCLMGRANGLVAQGDLEGALATMKRLGAECPETEEGRRAASGIARIERLLAAKRDARGGAAPGEK